MSPKMIMLNVTFELNGHRVAINRIDSTKRFYPVWYHHGVICEHLFDQPTQKKAIAEARRILREKNNA